MPKFEIISHVFDLQFLQKATAGDKRSAGNLFFGRFR